MKPHPRIRKTIKWGGLALTVLLAVVWIGSGWWAVGVDSGLLGGARVGNGSFVWSSKTSLSRWEMEWDFDPPPLFNRWMWSYPWSDRPPAHGRLVFAWNAPPAFTTIWVVGWLPVLLAAIPTSLAWRRDTLARRHERARQCRKCGYDRTGLASAGGLCPECGSPPPSPRSAA